MKVAPLFLCMLFFNCCAYKLLLLQDDCGKYFLHKSHKDFEKQQSINEENAFKSAKKINYTGYKGKITSDTTHGLTYFQFGSVRLYLFGNQMEKYNSLFNEGLISNELIYCYFNENCLPPADTSKVFDEVTFNILNWNGPALRISFIEEISRLRTSEKRRFIIWLHEGKVNYYTGASKFYFEITNDEAEKETSLEDFIKNATVTVFDYCCMVI